MLPGPWHASVSCFIQKDPSSAGSMSDPSCAGSMSGSFVCWFYVRILHVLVLCQKSSFADSMPHCNYHLLDWVSEGKMKEKRILLTTLGSTGNNRLDYKYFYYDRNGWFNYCNSLSIAEAGTKYILSKK